MQKIAAALLAASLLAPAAADQTERAARPYQAPGAWVELAPGNSIAAWRGYQTNTVPPGWTVVDGVLSKQRPVADIITREQFGDFELSLEWRISEGGNAGIFYRGTEEYPRIYWTAPEYQLLDDAKAPDGRNRLTSAGSAYGLYTPQEGHLKPIGEWNETRILAKRGKVEHWLNGVKLLEYELGSPDWTAKVKASKFNAWPNYGLAKKGHIALQGDHAGTLAFRNVKIRELK